MNTVMEKRSAGFLVDVIWIISAWADNVIARHLRLRQKVYHKLNSVNYNKNVTLQKIQIN